MLSLPASADRPRLTSHNLSLAEDAKRPARPVSLSSEAMPMRAYVPASAHNRKNHNRASDHRRWGANLTRHPDHRMLAMPVLGVYHRYLRALSFRTGTACADSKMLWGHLVSCSSYQVL